MAKAAAQATIDKFFFACFLARVVLGSYLLEKVFYKTAKDGLRKEEDTQKLENFTSK